MVIRLVNTFNGEDYNRIVDVLTSGSYIQADGVSRVSLTSSVSLDPPLEYLSPIRLETSDSKTYNSNVFLNFHKLVEGNMLGVLRNSREDLRKKKFETKGGERALNISKYGYGFLAQVVPQKKYIKVESQRSREIKLSVLEQDVPLLIKLSKSLVNATYTHRPDLNLDIYTKLGVIKFPYMIAVKSPQRPQNQKKFSISKPDTTFDDIGGCEEAKEELQFLSYGLANPEAFKRWGLKPTKGILLSGEPGTGKTLLAEATANSINAPFLSVSCADIANMWYGESEKLMNAAFDTAQSKAPSILFFDEIDSIIPRRENTHEATQKTVSTFLSRMDGIRELKDVTVLGATNYLERVDRAALRPGRFEEIIQVPMPDEKARYQIYGIHCRGRRVCEEIDYSVLAKKSEGFNGDDIRAVVTRGLKSKLKKEINGEKVGPVTQAELEHTITEYLAKRKKLNCPDLSSIIV